MARTASGTSPWPVTTITGRPALRRTSSSCSSSPSISGIRMSAIRQPGRPGASLARKAPADSNVSAAKPSASSNAWREPRTSSSSSTMKIVTRPVIAQTLRPLLAPASRNRNCVPPPGLGATHNRPPCASTMPLQIDSPMPSPRDLGCGEGLEQLRQDLRIDPRPAVGRPRLRRNSGRGMAVVITISRRGAPCSASAALRIRLTMTCWIWIRSNRSGGRPGSSLVCDIEIAIRPRRRGPAQSASSTDALRSSSARFGSLFSMKSRRRRMICPARPVCATAFSRSSLARTAAGSSDRLQTASRRVHIVHHRGQRLVELMGERTGQLTHRRQPAAHAEARSAAPEPRCSLRLALAQVVDDAEEYPILAQPALAHRQIHGKGRAVLAQRRDLAANADDARLAGFEIAGHIGVMLVAIGLRHQHGDIAAQDLVRRVAEQPLGGPVEEHHLARARR